MFGKKKKEQDSIDYDKLKIPHKSDEIKGTEFYKKEQKKKKELLPKDVLTREELIKYLEKDIKARKYDDSNPFKTEPDYLITFFDEKMRILRKSVPFQEMGFKGTKILIHKEYRNGEIIIKDLLPLPQLEINTAEEIANKETTKKQLEAINTHLKFIKSQISAGKDKYKLIDVQDLKEEKHRLEGILQSIKYGDLETFEFQDPTNLKKHFWLRRRNGEFYFLKVTKEGILAEENKVRLIKGTNIIREVEKVVNLRNKLNLKGILWGLGAVILIALNIWAVYEFATFDEELFDTRVNQAVEIRTIAQQEEIDYLRGLIRTTDPSIRIDAGTPPPSFEEVR